MRKTREEGKSQVPFRYRKSKMLGRHPCGCRRGASVHTRELKGVTPAGEGISGVDCLSDTAGEH